MQHSGGSLAIRVHLCIPTWQQRQWNSSSRGSGSTVARFGSQERTAGRSGSAAAQLARFPGNDGDQQPLCRKGLVGINGHQTQHISFLL